MSVIIIYRGRIAHQRHFTFKSCNGEKAVTLVCDGIDGCVADDEQPMVSKDSWLQIYCSKQLCQDLLEALQPVLDTKEVC